MYRVVKSNEDIFGMARVGYTLDSYEIYVNTNDGGNIPHFHYRNKDWSFHTCICIDRADYFHHDGKEDWLSSQQKKQLVKFLSGPVSLDRYKGKFSNNWELVCFLWDLNNSDVCISDDVTMPNYRDLPTS